MPTVLREEGFAIVVYPNDHLPYHVHVIKAESEAKINLDPVEVVTNRMKPQDLRKALKIVITHQAKLIEKWKEIHG